MRYDITVDGIPKAQPRVKARRFHDRAMVYDPGTSDGWKLLVASAASRKRPASPIAGPVQLSIDFHMPRPKKLMRKSDPVEVVPHTAKPDADNLGKAVMDSLTQAGWWLDDAQVFGLIVRKFYHRKDGRPGARITIVAG